LISVNILNFIFGLSKKFQHAFDLLDIFYHDF